MDSAAPRPPLRWAIVGPGRIAHRFAEAVQGLEGHGLEAVVARDASRGDAFAARWPDRSGRRAQRVGKLDALLQTRAVDAVYIATPHPQHHAFARRCLEAGMPVLCEKPMTMCARDTVDLVATARRHRAFLMEAVWTRFLPVYRDVEAWLREGRIGAVRALRSSFCFAVPFDPASRLFDPQLGGGALLDIGVYNLHVTRWALQRACGGVPTLRSWHASGTLAASGVEQRAAAQFDFEPATGERLHAQFVCAFDGRADNRFVIEGERGLIEIESGFWQATRARLQVDGAEPERAERPFAINGFEGQIEEVRRCLAAGAVESPQMPHDESIAVAEWVDRLRGAVGAAGPQG